MDLWIRSQDRKQLIKAEYINISSDGYRILANGFDYGFYETSKRALEVLDEIFDRLEDVDVTEKDTKKEAVIGSCKTYEMPEE